ncbi:MAG: hypothetical protein QOG31_911 [Thermoplasmata archaeon]|jgi:hypothetical protein|nr:hypothetical protein [Thermoplasmata archaeon]
MAPSIPLPALAAVLALSAAGCIGDSASTATQAPTGPVDEAFDALAPDGKPSGWTVHKGSWGAASNATDAAHPLVLRGAGVAEPGLSSIVPPQSFTDFEATVAFKMLSGQHPQGAGLVLQFKDDDNYQIIRYSTTENGWHLFTVTAGNREKQGSASVAGETHPEQNQWVNLRVVSSGGHVQAFDGATKVIDYTLPATASHSGGVGPFVRGDTVAVFDDLKVHAA